MPGYYNHFPTVETLGYAGEAVRDLQARTQIIEIYNLSYQLKDYKSFLSGFRIANPEEQVFLFANSMSFI